MILAVENMTNNNYNWKYDNHNDAYLKHTLLRKVMTPRFQIFVEPGWKDDGRGRDNSLIQFSFSSLNIALILLLFDSLSHPHHSSPTLIHLSSCLIRSFFIPPLRSFSSPPISLLLFIHSISVSFSFYFSLPGSLTWVSWFLKSHFPSCGKCFSNFSRCTPPFTPSTKTADHFSLQKIVETTNYIKNYQQFDAKIALNLKTA